MTVALFDKYGGVPAVTRIVRDLHERLMRRPNLRRYFEEMEMDKVIQHHIAMFPMLLANRIKTSR